MKKLKKPTKLLLATNGLILLSFGMFAPIYAIFVEDIGGDLMDASIAGGIFALTAGIVSLVSGRITDRIKQKHYVIVAGYFIMSIGAFLYLIVDSIYFLFAVQVLVGLGEAIYSPSFDALYGKNIRKSQSGLEWGAWESMNYFTIAIGAFFGGLLVTNLGFASIFILMGTLSFLSGLYLLYKTSRENCKMKK